MKLKLVSLAMFAALLGAFVLAPISARAQDSYGLPVTAAKNVTAKNPEGTKSFAGTWVLSEFVVEGDTIYAVGQLTGDVMNKSGKVTNSLNETVALPVIEATPDPATGSINGTRALQAVPDTCSVLRLVLGPIDLSLLGLNIFIGGLEGGPLLIDINATPGGGLLGDLLCGLAGGPPTGPLGEIANALNGLVEAINGLLGLLG